MKKDYQRPTLIEYGTLQELTHGATGTSPDYNFIGGQLTPDNDSPTCTTNVVSGACVKF